MDDKIDLTVEAIFSRELNPDYILSEYEADFLNKRESDIINGYLTPKSALDRQYTSNPLNFKNVSNSRSFSFREYLGIEKFYNFDNILNDDLYESNFKNSEYSIISSLSVLSENEAVKYDYGQYFRDDLCECCGKPLLVLDGEQYLCRSCDERLVNSL